MNVLKEQTLTYTHILITNINILKTNHTLTFGRCMPGFKNWISKKADISKNKNRDHKKVIKQDQNIGNLKFYCI